MTPDTSTGLQALKPKSDRLPLPFSAPNPMAHGAPRPGVDFRWFPRVRCSVISTSSVPRPPCLRFHKETPLSVTLPEPC